MEAGYFCSVRVLITNHHLKITRMKKLLVVLALGTFAACNSGDSSSTTDSTSTTVSSDTTTTMSTPSTIDTTGTGTGTMMDTTGTGTGNGR